jgi:hypothetical protein
MRYALLLTGQPRYREKALDSIIKNIINCNNIDVYCHFWRNSARVPKYSAIAGLANQIDVDMNNNDETFINLIKHKLPSGTVYEIEDQINFQPDKYYPGTEHDGVIRDFGPDVASQHFSRCNFSVQSQWYSIMKAKNLINCEYDGVFRTRIDILFSEPVILDSYSTEKLHIPFCPDPIDEQGIQQLEDPMAFGSQKLMNIYCDNYLFQEETLAHPSIMALLSGYPLGIYLKKYVGYENLLNTNFELGDHWTRKIIR